MGPPRGPPHDPYGPPPPDPYYDGPPPPDPYYDGPPGPGPMPRKRRWGACGEGMLLRRGRSQKCHSFSACVCVAGVCCDAGHLFCCRHVRLAAAVATGLEGSSWACFRLRQLFLVAVTQLYYCLVHTQMRTETGRGRTAHHPGTMARHPGTTGHHPHTGAMTGDLQEGRLGDILFGSEVLHHVHQFELAPCCAAVVLSPRHAVVAD